MAPIVTERHTFIAPFVNAERPQYLVVEDLFPNGRPMLEKAGVYMTDPVILSPREFIDEVVTQRQTKRALT